MKINKKPAKRITLFFFIFILFNWLVAFIFRTKGTNTKNLPANFVDFDLSTFRIQA